MLQRDSSKRIMQLIADTFKIIVDLHRRDTNPAWIDLLFLRDAYRLERC